MATHSSILAWKISWTEKPGGLQSMGSQRVGHNWATNTHIMNNAINEIKNTPEGANSRIMEAEVRISEVEDRMVEINETERKKEKQIKRNEDNLRDLWDNVKRPNIWIIGVPEEEDKKKDHEKILQEIIVENFPKIGKEIITQVQDTQRVPNRINSRRNTPRHMLIKFAKIKHRANIKGSKEKATHNTQGDPHKDTNWSFNRNSSGQKGMAGHT